MSFPDNPFSTGVDAKERRAAALRAEQERADARHAKIAAQASPLMSAQERIRLWEELHGLALPRSKDHRLVRLIASHTALSVRDVQDEQARRNGEAIEARP